MNNSILTSHLHVVMCLYLQACLGGNSCCTPENPCPLGEGDCDSDDDCQGEGECNNDLDNCIGDTFDAWKDDCCGK